MKKKIEKLDRELGKKNIHETSKVAAIRKFVYVSIQF